MPSPSMSPRSVKTVGSTGKTPPRDDWVIEFLFEQAGETAEQPRPERTIMGGKDASELRVEPEREAAALDAVERSRLGRFDIAALDFVGQVRPVGEDGEAAEFIADRCVDG